MKVWVVIPASNFTAQLKYLLQSLNLQEDLGFTVVVIGNDDVPADIQSNFPIKKISTNFPFHRSRTRNAVLADIEVADSDLILFVDADSILSSNFLREAKKLHEMDCKAITYGIRKELSLVQTTHLPNVLTLDTLTELENEDTLVMPWLIRSMFMGVRAGLLRNVGGFPEYMEGWGGEDLALHVSLVERQGARIYPQLRCVGFHQWHLTEGNYPNERKNWAKFLKQRSIMIDHGKWFCDDGGRLAACGRYLIELRMVHELDRFQLIALDMETSALLIISSSDHSAVNALQGNVTGFLAGADSFEVYFSIKDQLGNTKWMRKNLGNLTEPPVIVNKVEALSKFPRGAMEADRAEFFSDLVPNYLESADRSLD